MDRGARPTPDDPRATQEDDPAESGPRVFVGTSGWQYADWRGRFYPRGLHTEDWLAHYASSFGTVEVNASFYRLPPPETVGRWAEIVPDGFLLTFKASRYLTHVRRLVEPEEPLSTMWRSFSRAGSKLGAVLFQFPPSLPVQVERLTGLLRVLPRGIRAAFEFRHPSWSTTEVERLLDGAGCCLVHADRPGVRPGDVPTIGGWSYVRFHQGRRAHPGYDARKLRSYADVLAGLGCPEVFVYFNNDQLGAAVRDAMRLTELLRTRGAASR